MIERMAKPNQTRCNGARIRRFQRERFKKALDRLNSFERWPVNDGFADEPAADGIDRA